MRKERRTTTRTRLLVHLNVARCSSGRHADAYRAKMLPTAGTERAGTRSLRLYAPRGSTETRTTRSSVPTPESGEREDDRAQLQRRRITVGAYVESIILIVRRRRRAISLVSNNPVRRAHSPRHPHHSIARLENSRSEGACRPRGTQDSLASGTPGESSARAELATPRSFRGSGRLEISDDVDMGSRTDRVARGGSPFTKSNIRVVYHLACS